MASKKIQLYTDRANTIEASPETSANCVILSDGNDLQKVLDNDLTNPTVVHEETSFKVGVGDIDVSSSVVDGEVGRMVIKGKTYQNILPEPSTHVLTNNKEMFKVNEELDPNVEIVDGVSKSAILRGQTLVNLVKTSVYGGVQNGTCVDGDYPYKVIESIVGVGASILTRFQTIYPLSPSTVYYLKLTDIAHTNAFLVREHDNGKNLITEIHDLKNKIIKFTTSELGTSDLFFYQQQLQVGAKVKYSENFIISDDVDSLYNVNDYFTGMQSVKVPVLSTVGKNVVNEKIWEIEAEEEGYQCLLSAGWATEVGKSGNPIIIPVHVEKGKVYTLKCKNKATQHFNDFYFMDDLLNGKVKSFRRSVGKNKTLNSFVDTIITFTADRDYKYLQIDTGNDIAKGYIVKNTLQLEEGSIATPYEPYKTNILHTPEEVVLREVNGVQDTLNLNTREYVQRIGQVMLDGSNDEVMSLNTGSPPKNEELIRVDISGVFNGLTQGNKTILCSHFPSTYIHGLTGGSTQITHECVSNQSNQDNKINLVIKHSKLATPDVAGLRAYLQSNPMTVQYELATPVVKTVDLSSSGNWEKIVLDGSEGWSKRGDGDGSTTIGFHTPVNGVDYTLLFAEGIERSQSSTDGIEGYGFDRNQKNFFIELKRSRLTTVDVNGFKQYLQQNPITLWYQTTTHQDSTQVKQPIFFKDGHIQLSSGVDNSLIPTLDYQAKTSNSYVMDLMKTNTKYTMKAKTASGTFTVDGTSYGAGTNGTFTTPSSMTNKLLVMSNKTNEEVMIIEGDVTSKTIPYFKGIKSAFEDKDKIEVLSTSKNLLPSSLYVDNYTSNGITVTVEGNVFTLNGTCTQTFDLPFVPQDYSKSVKLYSGKQYKLSINRISGTTTYANGVSAKVLLDDGNVRWAIPSPMPMDGIATWFRFVPKVGNVFDNYSFTIQLEEAKVSTDHEPHKSNSTKIPLLSPLRSLPDGTCDELIIDRMKKRATLIQRVGYVKFDNMDKLSFEDDGRNQYLYLVTDRHIYFANRMELSNAPAIFSHFAYYTDGGLWGKDRGDYAAASNAVFCWCMPTKRDKKERESHLRNLAKQDGVIVQYQLATPVVTEVDLEGFPLVYKDGRIFLNSEIAPKVEIDYNVNQSQQIQSNNETLQRHELDILDLDNLIVSFVNAEYNLRLLKFNMELSMMALAE